jgi:hypothetical protein
VGRVYQWTEDEDDIALDAVTVGISSDTRLLKVAGLQFGQRNAAVYWPDWDAGIEPAIAGVEGPMSVPNALTRAEDLQLIHGFRRVVVWVQHRELWDERWGELSQEAGL